MCSHNENIDIHNSSMAIHNWNKDFHNWVINFHNWILDVHNWIMDTHNWIIKSPGISGVTLCFCAGWYAPLPSPPPTTTDICSHDNFWTTFRISFIFCKINALTCILDYLIRFWSIFVLTLTLNWIFKVKYGICYNATTNGLMPRNEKQT